MTEQPDRYEWPPPWFDPERHALVTPTNVQALAHPIRMAILQLLRVDGPSTSTALGTRLGHSSGVTSYHLRVLADAGLVTEDASLGNRRERWWRAAYEAQVFTFRAPGQSGTAAQIETAQQFIRATAQLHYERVLNYIDTLVARADELTELPWQIGEISLSVTREEARELSYRLYELFAPYRRDQRGVARGPGGPDETVDGDGRERATIQFQLLPEDNHAAASGSVMDDA